MVMRKRSRVVRTATTYGILIVALLWTIFPIYWIIRSSLTLSRGVYAARPPLFSNVVTFDHYIGLVYNTSFTHNVWSNFVIAAITTIIYLTIGILGSYAMTRFKYPGGSFFRSSIIISYLIPTAVPFVPMCVFVSNLGFYNNKCALLIIYPTFVVPYCYYMFISYSKVIPCALEEAALIDGCNHLQTLWYIIMLIALPGIVVVATFAFTMVRSEYSYATIMATSDMQKMTTVVISGFKYADSAIWGKIMSASVACSLPITLLYIATQSMLILGRYEGSVK